MKTFNNIRATAIVANAVLITTLVLGAMLIKGCDTTDDIPVGMQCSMGFNSPIKPSGLNTILDYDLSILEGLPLDIVCSVNVLNATTSLKEKQNFTFKVEQKGVKFLSYQKPNLKQETYRIPFIISPDKSRLPYVEQGVDKQIVDPLDILSGAHSDDVEP